MKKDRIFSFPVVPIALIKQTSKRLIGKLGPLNLLLFVLALQKLSQTLRHLHFDGLLLLSRLQRFAEESQVTIELFLPFQVFGGLEVESGIGETFVFLVSILQASELLSHFIVLEDRLDCWPFVCTLFEHGLDEIR